MQITAHPQIPRITVQTTSPRPASIFSAMQITVHPQIPKITVQTTSPPPASIFSAMQITVHPQIPKITVQSASPPPASIFSAMQITAHPQIPRITVQTMCAQETGPNSRHRPTLAFSRTILVRVLLCQWHTSHPENLQILQILIQTRNIAHYRINLLIFI